MVSVFVNKKSLIKTIKQLHVVRGGKSARVNIDTIELTVTDGMLKLAIPGSVFSLKCVTNGSCKASLMFFYFQRLVEDCRDADFEIIFTDDTMEISSVIVKVKTTFFTDDSILRTIDLPINYNKADLIRLATAGYTKEELEFNQVLNKIEIAEKDLVTDVKHVYKILQNYGFSYQGILDLVNDKIGRK